MLIACWSSKGGCGTTVVTAALAIALAHDLRADVVVADLAGDIPTVLGLSDPPADRGLRQWLAAEPGVGVDALRRLLLAGADGVSVLPAGSGVAAARDGRADDLVDALSTFGLPVVADCGTLADDAQVSVAAGASVSLAVLRPCYLALHRATAAPVRPSGVVLLNEPKRVLGRRDVEDVLGVPVRAEVDVDPSIARAVDAGLLGQRLPVGVLRALRAAA